MEQRTEEWYLARKGMITASEVYCLLNNRKEPMTDEEIVQCRTINQKKSKSMTKLVPFSDTTFRYLKEKVSEVFMTDSCFLEDMELRNTPTKAMTWGIEWEDDARQKYSDITGREVEQVGFIPLRCYELIAGGSPDGIVQDGNKKGIIEIKCPWNPNIHLDHYMLRSAQELKEYNLQYYAQMQFNMMCVGATFGDFISYDPRIDSVYSIKVLRVPYDNSMTEMLKERLELAAEWMIERSLGINSAQSIIINN